MLVDTVDKTLNTFTVKARWHGGTTAVAHAIGASIDILAMAEVEGEVSGSYVVGDRIERTNVFQEIDVDVKLTNRAIEKALKDRDITPDEARNKLREEEQIRQTRKLIKQMNAVARRGVPSYDAATGQNTMAGYEYLISNRGWQTQATLGYVTGAFDYATWTTMMHNMHKRGSNAMIIHTNVATKSKIIGFHDTTLYRKDAKDLNNGVGMFFDYVIAQEWDGRALYFLIDEDIKGSQFNLINFDNMEIVPRRNIYGEAKMFNFANEHSDTNSKTQHTVLTSEISLELFNGEGMAICKNV